MAVIAEMPPTPWPTMQDPSSSKDVIHLEQTQRPISRLPKPRVRVPSVARPRPNLRRSRTSPHLNGLGNLTAPHSAPVTGRQVRPLPPLPPQAFTSFAAAGATSASASSSSSSSTSFLYSSPSPTHLNIPTIRLPIRPLPRLPPISSVTQVMPRRRSKLISTDNRPKGIVLGPSSPITNSFPEFDRDEWPLAFIAAVSAQREDELREGGEWEEGTEDGSDNETESDGASTIRVSRIQLISADGSKRSTLISIASWNTSAASAAGSGVGSHGGQEDDFDELDEELDELEDCDEAEIVTWDLVVPHSASTVQTFPPPSMASRYSKRWYSEKDGKLVEQNYESALEMLRAL